jgi:UDP-glucuronate decarboxylase
MRILVTGGAGFLGSHLCDSLLNQGNEVICLDNFYTGNKKNIEHLIGHKNFEIMRHDVIDPFKVEVDQIYNLACPASPVQYQNNPIKTIKTSVMGAINCLGLAKRVKARVFQASTSEIYGDPLESPQNEMYWGHTNPIGKRACYDEGKRCAETLFFDYYRQNAVDIRVARIFNTYGPRMLPDDGRVISSFIHSALQNEPIRIYGEGKQTRSFCHVDDMVEGMILFMNQEKQMGPLNLGSDFEIAIVDLANLIIKLTKSDSKIYFDPLPEDDPMQRRPDISAAEALINWRPKIDLEAGLVDLVKDALSFSK